jgi:hypothetical protein
MNENKPNCDLFLGDIPEENTTKRIKDFETNIN